MSHIDSREAILNQSPLATATVAWPPLPYRRPYPRHIDGLGTTLPAWPGAVKRGFDIAFAVVTLIIHVPLLLAAAVAIKLDSPGPVLFRQRRIGLHGRSFELLKFRTMQDRPFSQGPLCQTCRHDPRVTRVGAVLRRTSFDELPQLWNVLRGDMSLVGPRPHAPGTCVGNTPFEQVSDCYPLRHRVRPGMTGLAQVRGWRGQTDTREKLLRRLDSDLEYIATWSLGTDFLILLRTIATLWRNAY
ncbi:MAG TPA: sugar transferase [Acetobacteraceae bacterium]|nr:sugar transferase [Acetobacteraceae bacterium]